MVRCRRCGQRFIGEEAGAHDCLFAEPHQVRFIHAWGRCVLAAMVLENRGVTEPPESRARREGMARMALREVVDWKWLADEMEKQECLLRKETLRVAPRVVARLQNTPGRETLPGGE